MKKSMKPGSNVLVVDNEISLLTVLENELTDIGYNVRTATDGDEAMECIKTSAVDLVVLDLKMPNVDGFVVLQFIKNFYPHIKVIVVTGYADLTNAIRCKKLGADQFVPKPYNIADLAMEMQKLVPIHSGSAVE